MRNSFSLITLLTSTFSAGAISAADTANIDMNGVHYELEITSCSSAETHYFIDAEGEKLSLSLVGALTGDNQYSTIDFFYVEGGDDLRAGTTTKPVLLDGGKFQFDGEVDISNGTKADMRVVADAC